MNIREFLNNSIWREEQHDSANIDSSPSLKISDDNFAFADSVANELRDIWKQSHKSSRT